MAQQYEHKRGNTFIADCVYRDALGNPVDLVAAGINVSSKFVANDKTFPLTVQLGSLPGRFQVSGQTADWPYGKGFWDVTYEKSGNITSTETVLMRVIR